MRISDWSSDVCSSDLSFHRVAMKTHLQELLGSALDQLLAGTEAVRPAINLDATKDAKFGDFQTNLALQLAKPLGKPPRAVAEAIVAALPASPQLAKAEIAGPGFINFFLKRAAFQSVEIGRASGRARVWKDV